MTKETDSDIPEEGRDRPEPEIEDVLLDRAFDAAYLALTLEADCYVGRRALAEVVAAYAAEIETGLSRDPEERTQAKSGIFACIRNRTLALAERERW